MKFKLNPKSIGYGAAAGAAEPWASQLLGPNLGPAAADIAVGAFSGNDTLQTIGGMRLGRLALSQAPGGTVSGGGI